MLDTKSKVINRIVHLSSVAAALSKAPAEKVLQLRDDLLALPEDGCFQPGGQSGLNADGTPLQFCISSSGEGWNGRFISDPACVIGSPADRYQHSYAALQKLYVNTGTQGIRHVCEDMLAFNLYDDNTENNDSFDDHYPDGVLWLGASPDMNGLAVYMDGRRGGHEASWKRLSGWLNHLMPQNTDVETFIDNTAPHASIMSVGLEGSTIENLRAKVYFRLLHPVLLKDLGIGLLERDEFPSFLQDVIGNRDMRLSGLVFNIGFHIASGKMFDAKIDICGCDNCANLDADSWIKVLQSTTAKYRLAQFPVDSGMLTDQCKVSYYGIGVTRKGDVRMNLYLKNKLD